VIVFSPSANAFRFYDDDADEATSTPLANQDTNYSADVNAGDFALQLRYRIQNTTAVAGSATDDWTLQVSKNGGAYTSITTATSNVKATASGLTNDGATTNRGTNGITDGTGSFVAGEQSSDGTIDNNQLTASNYTEQVWGITLVKADLTNADTLDFRVSLNGASPGMTNAVTPRITVVKAQAITMVAAQGSISLTAQTTTLVRKLTITAAQGSYSVTGQDVTAVKKFTLTGELGTYTLTGQAADFSALGAASQILAENLDSLITESGNALIVDEAFAGSIIAAAGTYTLTGQTASLTHAGTLTAANGTYTTTGQVISLGRGIGAAYGTYTVSGQDVAFKRAYVLAAQGSYSLTGQAASLSKTTAVPPIIGAGQGTYTLTGQDAGVTADYILTADYGTYTLTGQSIAASRAYSVTAGQGSYSLAGQSTNVTAQYLLSASNGIYFLTGGDARLAKNDRAVEVGAGGAIGNISTRVRRRRYILPDGTAVSATDSEINGIMLAFLAEQVEPEVIEEVKEALEEEEEPSVPTPARFPAAMIEVQSPQIQDRRIEVDAETALRILVAELQFRKRQRQEEEWLIQMLL
jgi:hypothetical protein